VIYKEAVIVKWSPFL